MSGIVGFVNNSDRPADITVLSQMAAATEYRAVDDFHTWVDGPVALAFQLLATTPDALSLKQPWLHPPSGVCIAFDGRIDNRETLLAGIASGKQLAAVPDAELALRAYLQWGPDCCARIIGDFAFVVWDGRCQRLLAARDFIGTRSLHYYHDREKFVFGTEPANLLRHPAVSREVNEGMVAETLAHSTFGTRDETLYQDIKRLPPAHYLLLQGGELQVTRYWQLDETATVRFSRFEDYLENFLELLTQAVSDRLRRVGPIGISLSGGLDSALLAGIAQGQLHRSGGTDPLLALTLLLDYDESAAMQRNVNSVVTRWGLRSRQIDASRFEAPDWIAQTGSSGLPPNYPIETVMHRLRKEAKDSGIRVTLSGIGAYTWLGGSQYPYWEYLSRGEYGAIVDEFRMRARDYGWRFALSRMARSLTWPLLPSALRASWESGRRHYSAPLLSSDFSRRIDLNGRLASNDSDGSLRSMSRWESRMRLQSGGLDVTLEALERADASYAQEQRHPFHDRRLAEFAFALPQIVKRGGGPDKRLLRESGGLPDCVVNHPAAEPFGTLVHQALLEQQVTEVLSDAQVVRRGWVDGDRLNAAMAGLNQPWDELSHAQEMSLARIWQVFSLEIWCRHAFVGQN